MTAESVVYCNFGINLDEFNISSKTLFTLTFTKDFTYLLKCKVIYLGFKRILQILKNIPQAVFETLDLKHENRCEPHQPLRPLNLDGRMLLLFFNLGILLGLDHEDPTEYYIVH